MIRRLVGPIRIVANSRRYETSSVHCDDTLTNDTATPLHVPVMLNEVLKHLVESVDSFETYCDLTFGAGGHTKAILKSNSKAKVYALDRDPFAYKLACDLKQTDEYQGRIVPMNGRFSQIEELFKENDVKRNSLDAALIDCGCSSIQLETAHRGFSVIRDGPLDMRMGSSNEKDTISAADAVNRLSEEALGKIIWRYGEEKYYKKIARGIGYYKSRFGDIKTTKQLTDIISTIVKEVRHDSLERSSHVATKTFQALRIFVNNELNELYNAINIIHKYLKPGGRLAVISFHSLEDRIVKTHFNSIEIDKLSQNESFGMNEKTLLNLFDSVEQMKHLREHTHKLWTPMNKKVIVPTKEEIERNARSRSAKLRIAIKNKN